MTKAENREQFISAWEEEFDVCAMLSSSLPTAGTPNIALEYLNKLRELRLKYIALAVNDTWGLRFCRYCEHLKDLSDGQTGANAPGSHCELDLVKPEIVDLTAATCPKYQEGDMSLPRRPGPTITAAQDPTKEQPSKRKKPARFPGTASP